MRVLALDTTTADGSVAVVDDSRVLVERRGDAQRSHTERLPNELVTALHEAGMTTRDVELFAVVAGPGSFTGLRTGIAAIQGMAVVRKTPVVALSALDVLGAAAAIDRAPGTIVAAWMDARRKEVFSTLYRVTEASPFTPEGLEVIETASVGFAADTWARWRRMNTAPAVICGDGATLYADVVSGAAAIMPHPLLAPVAARMAAARAGQGSAVGPAGVQPIYVRRPDVEVARDAKLAAAQAPLVKNP